VDASVCTINSQSKKSERRPDGPSWCGDLQGGIGRFADGFSVTIRTPFESRCPSECDGGVGSGGWVDAGERWEVEGRGSLNGQRSRDETRWFWEMRSIPFNWI
jgi:hypothetical protein